MDIPSVKNNLERLRRRAKCNLSEILRIEVVYADQ